MKFLLLSLLITMMTSINVYSITLKEWKKLNSEEKVEVLDSLESVNTHFDELEDSKLKKNLSKISEKILNEDLYDNISNDLSSIEGICQIGQASPGHVEIYSIEDTPVAVSLGHSIGGGAMSDDEQPIPSSYYATVEEAQKDGVDTGADVSWSLNSILEITSSSNLKILKLDTYEEGGFSWSGW